MVNTSQHQAADSNSNGKGSLKKVVTHHMLSKANTMEGQTTLNKTKVPQSEDAANNQIRSNSVGFSNNLTTTAQTKQSTSDMPQ